MWANRLCVKVRVCMWNNFYSSEFSAGNAAFHWDCVQRSYQWNGDIQLGQLDVPAIRLFHWRWHGTGLSREPLNRVCTVVAIWDFLRHHANLCLHSIWTYYHSVFLEPCHSPRRDVWWHNVAHGIYNRLFLTIGTLTFSSSRWSILFPGYSILFLGGPPCLKNLVAWLVIGIKFPSDHFNDRVLV